MRGRIHVDQVLDAARRGEERGTRKGEVANADDELRTGTAAALRDAAPIPDLELREPEGQAPGWRPLEPPRAQRALRELDMVGLLQPIIDGAHHQADLYADSLDRALEIHVATRTDAEHRVREPKPVLDGLAADGDCVTPERRGRRDRVRPCVAPNRLVHCIDAQRRPAQKLPKPPTEIVGIRTG